MRLGGSASGRRPRSAAYVARGGKLGIVASLSARLARGEPIPAQSLCDRLCSLATPVAGVACGWVEPSEDLGAILKSARPARPERALRDRVRRPGSRTGSARGSGLCLQVLPGGRVVVVAPRHRDEPLRLVGRPEQQPPQLVGHDPGPRPRGFAAGGLGIPGSWPPNPVCPPRGTCRRGRIGARPRRRGRRRCSPGPAPCPSRAARSTATAPPREWPTKTMSPSAMPARPAISAAPPGRLRGRPAYSGSPRYVRSPGSRRRAPSTGAGS